MTPAETQPTPAPTSPSSEPAAATTPQPSAPAAPAAASPTAAEARSRPEGLPDQFWDEKAGVKFGDLTKHLDEMAALKASQDSRTAAVPEKPDDYELKLPSDLKFGDGESFDLNPDDPMVKFGRQVAHAMGADQSGFEKLVGLYAQREIANAKELQALEAKQVEALGAKGQERIGAAKSWLTAKIGPNAEAVFAPVLMLKSGVEAVEKIMRVASGGGTPGYSPIGRDRGDDAKTEFEALPPGQRTGRQGFAFVRQNVKQG